MLAPQTPVFRNSHHPASLPRLLNSPSHASTIPIPTSGSKSVSNSSTSMLHRTSSGCASHPFTWMVRPQVGSPGTIPFLKWLDLRYHLCCQFDKQLDHDHYTSFTCIEQRSTIVDYIRDFEELSNRARGFSLLFHLQTFQVGLKPALGREV